MTHLDDGALLRLLDGEGSRAERAQLVTHIETCEACNRRHSLLSAWSRAASDVLFRTDGAPRVFALHENGRGPVTLWRWWPAAAAVVLLVGGTVAVAAPPLRTWMVQRWATLGHLLHVPPSPPSGTQPVGAPGDRSPAQAPSPAVGEVVFTPDSDVLTVRVATRQAEGSLVLETSTTSTAAVMVRGQGEHEAVVVLPDELRIANTVGSRATYRVTLPARLKRVIVVVDGDQAFSLDPVAPGESRAIDLQTKGRRP